MRSLLTEPIAQPKANKSLSLGYATWLLHLSSGKRVCKSATRECLALCLVNAGRAGATKADGTNRIQEARKRRTQEYFQDPIAFLVRLETELGKAIKKTGRMGMTPAFRLNATSDLLWEDERFPDGSTLMDRFPTVAFYDYTAHPQRYARFLRGDGGWPTNYHLTFSRKETAANREASLLFLSHGGTVSLPYWGDLPSRHLGYPVHDGDTHDWRPSDPPGHWVGLRFKGTKARRARAMSSGFALDTR